MLIKLRPLPQTHTWLRHASMVSTQQSKIIQSPHHSKFNHREIHLTRLSYPAIENYQCMKSCLLPINTCIRIWRLVLMHAKLHWSLDWTTPWFKIDHVVQDQDHTKLSELTVVVTIIYPQYRKLYYIISKLFHIVAPKQVTGHQASPNASEKQIRRWPTCQPQEPTTLQTSTPQETTSSQQIKMEAPSNTDYPPHPTNQNSRNRHQP